MKTHIEIINGYLTFDFLVIERSVCLRDMALDYPRGF